MRTRGESALATIQSVVQFDGLLFREVCYANNVAMRSHSHDEPQLFLCLAGAIRHDRGNRSRDLTPRMVAFLPAGEPHANRFYDGVRTFDIVLNAPWLERLRPFSPLIEQPTECVHGPPTWMGMRLYREFHSEDNLTQLMLEGLTLELLAQMWRHAPDRVDKSTPRWLVRTVEFLHAHFTANLSLDTIAAAAGVHPDHLNRVFRRHHRDSIGNYIRRLRIDYACHLLVTSEAPLSEIAVETGFADQSHFHKNFKRLEGVTPGQFRATAAVGFRQPMPP